MAFVGFNGVGVQITNATLGLVIVNSTGAQPYSAYALNASGTAALTGISALTLTGTLAIQISTLPAGVTENDTIQVPNPQSPGSTLPVTINFTGALPLALSGSVTLAIANFVTLSGSFTFAKSASNTITVIASNVSVFIGVGGTTPIGLQVSGGELGLRPAQFHLCNLCLGQSGVSLVCPACKSPAAWLSNTTRPAPPKPIPTPTAR